MTLRKGYDIVKKGVDMDIREGIVSLIRNMWAVQTHEDKEKCADEILAYLHREGVVRKVDIKIPLEGLWMPGAWGAWFIPKAVVEAIMNIAVEPLVKE